MSYEILASFYDSLTQDVRYDEYASYLDELIKKYNKDACIVLDAACGTGSITRRLSRLGYDMIGVDVSEEMLSVAKEKSDESILYLCQDLCELDLFGTVDVAVSTLDSINHIEKESLTDVFKKISLFMNKGGIFIFDVNSLYKHRCVLSNNTFVYDEENVYCVWQNFYNEDDLSIDIELDLFEKKDGCYVRHFESFSEYFYDDDFLKKLLAENGFELVSTFEALTSESVKEDSERIIYVARKK